MKISKVDYTANLAPYVNSRNSNVSAPKNISNQNSIQKLSNICYTPLNFTRKWSEHKSWGAQIDPVTKDVNFKFFSFPDNDSAQVEITSKSGKTRLFELENKGRGVFESGPISKSYAKAGDSYSFIFQKSEERYNRELEENNAKPEGYRSEVKRVEKVKDPYSYYQDKLLDESVLYDQSEYQWSDKNWFSRSKQRVSRLANSQNQLKSVNELRIYEVNIPTLTQEGTFDAAIEKLDKIKKMGYNAVEIMPVENTFSPQWGYDGVDKFAVAKHLGGPDGLKAFVDYAHSIGLNIIMDMVPNHIGPDGNQLARSGPYTNGYNRFGDAPNYEGENSRYVRDFIVNAALNWLENYHCDGLRLDMTQDMKSDFTMKQIAAEVNYHKPEAFLIAEDARYNVNVDKDGNISYDNYHVVHDRRVVNPLETWESGEGEEERVHEFALEDISRNNGTLARLGFDSEWDFPFREQLKEAMFGSLNMKYVTRLVYESEGRVKYLASHDDTGNFEGVRFVAKLIIPMLNLQDNIELNDDDIARAQEFSKYEGNAWNYVKSQKVQFAGEKLITDLLRGKYDKYTDAIAAGEDKYKVQERFMEEVLVPLGINKNSNITPERIKKMFEKSSAIMRMAHGFVYSSIGPMMTFQGDENLDMTPFRFFREFQSDEHDEDKRFIEKGYYTGKRALNVSKFDGIDYSDEAKSLMAKSERLIADLNKVKAQNSALTKGHYVKSNTVEHEMSEVIGLHTKDGDNEIFTVTNFANSSYPREDAGYYYIKFPAGEWVEIINTDDKKYGGGGRINTGVIKSNGIDNCGLQLAGNSTVMFKKVCAHQG